MPITNTDILAGFKRYGSRAIIDGATVVLTDLPTRTMSALRGRSICGVTVRDLPPDAGKPAQVDLVLDGWKTTRFFTGLTAERSSQSGTMQRTANLVDIMDLDKALGGSGLTWSGGVAFATAARALLNAAGIVDSLIDTIYDPGANYVLAPVYDIILLPTENARQLWDELMAFGGTAAFVTPSGRVRVVDASGVPMDYSGTIYAEGATGTELGLFDAGISIEGNETVVSVFTATGPKRPDGAVPDGTYTASGVVGKPGGGSFRFAQSDTVCQAIAARELSRQARARRSIWIDAPLNPNVLPGDTVLIRLPRIGLATNTPAYVLESATKADAGMRLIVSIGPSLVDGYSSSIAPPVVDFAMTVEHQLVTLSGVPVASYLVQCQDTSYDRAGYSIDSRSWAVTGTGASPTSSSDLAPIFLLTDLTGAEITLAVDSASGESGSVTRSPEANDIQVVTRLVSVAARADGWQVLADLSGWRTFTGAADCTAVPPFNESGPLWAGFADGAIYKSADALATAPALSTTLAAGVACLFVNEGDYNHILAGAGTILSRTTNGGTSWAVVKNFTPDTITDCQSSPSNPGEMRVTAGASEWLTFDGGVTWAAAITGDVGEALMIATAPWGHAVSFGGVGAEVDGAVLFEEGHVVNWAGIAPGDLPVDGLLSITPLLTEAGFIAGENDDLVRDGSVEGLMFSAGGGWLYKLLWDGSAFQASLLAPVAPSGPGKIVGQLDAYPIGAFDAVQIGYGPLGPLPVVVTATLIRTPYEASGAADKFWFYANGAWTGKTPPAAGKRWHWVVSNPLNYQELLAWHRIYDDNGLYHSSDFGETWTLVFGGLLTDNTPDPSAVCEFSSTTMSHWATTTFWYDSFDPQYLRYAALSRGIGNTFSFTTEHPMEYYRVGPGMNDELLSTRGGTLTWIDASNNFQAGPGPSIASQNIYFDGIPRTRQSLSYGANGILVTTDYRSAAWQAVSGASGTWASALANGSILVGGRSDGVQEVADAWGTPSASVVAFVGRTVGHIRTDRQTRTVAAVALDSATGVRSSAGVWTEITGPPAAGTSLSGWVEVVGV